ncbi:hypothetical protein [Phormidium sp. CCY1219]|uniref:hypothetical protein n=1 Tax=Phormidium sp. CCY1219 TaxID=2886104 RepID=UPI002D1E77F2|nr:hypothetical protein [Phormidium sp. CCY1219]MEB3829628.1 hypothetical protein [Phormidium sp. CCY1219]
MSKQTSPSHIVIRIFIAIFALFVFFAIGGLINAGLKFSTDEYPEEIPETDSDLGEEPEY